MVCVCVCVHTSRRREGGIRGEVKDEENERAA